ncbi:subtilisin-like protease SBT5.6 [Cajanus cajan]|uniref:Subtilisin-like protease n=1 Tax=Cajanus cajan TaxID=3821 RepID=A0A151R186_CAJCA|nr:subtilisin-like protease SBT5.6 [Cajanus cajan]KYP36368.1 Subtilisin-like protease [Cajanus cajan]
MAIKSIISATYFLLFLHLLLRLASCSTKRNQVYVVELFGEHSSSGDHKTLHEVENAHHSFLLSVKETEEDARASLLYSYKHTINGFAALLTPKEANKLSEMEGVVFVHKNQPRIYSLHTTRSWKFVGLDGPLNPQEEQFNHTNEDLLTRAKYGKDIIVGMIDSGVWPESKSFSDEGMDPVPTKWKGVCQNGTAFDSSQCNRKIIGARYYLHGYESIYGPLNEKEDYKSARDKDGHGSHTASIVGGRAVANASAMGGFAKGTAQGGAPLGRLAIYKACWPIKGQSKSDGNVCTNIDILKAIDDAIGDGVDVISISIGYSAPISYEEDVIARGALHGVRKNVVVVCSAGNSGPSPHTLSNPAPWIITVAANTVDRSFLATVKLTNGTRIQGRSITPVHMGNSLYPLVLAGDVEHPGLPSTNSGYCLDNTLQPNKVRGKIVLCLRGQGERLKKGLEVQRAGGVGFILGNNKINGNDVPSDPHFIPAAGVSYENALKLIHYVNSTPNPMAQILPGTTVLNTKPAPSMASFSSRGPNIVYPNILKPDITAPGVDILAAWTAEDGPTRMTFYDNRVVKYNIFSGTSMSCPHVAAAAVLLKAIHPTWSTAAIRSALITTAMATDNTGNPLTDETGNPATPFAMGSGHFHPKRAADPGLVYDASYMDYLLYTCSLGVTQNFNITYNCPKSFPEPFELNYPSIQIHRLNYTKTIKRTVTNVGRRRSVYMFSAVSPKEYSITATPNILKFNHVGQKMNFVITVTANWGQILTKHEPDNYYFGWYAWTREQHVVRSPVAVSFP